MSQLKIMLKPMIAALLAANATSIQTAPAQAEDAGPCMLLDVARSALTMAEQGVGMAAQLESAVDERLNESKSAFKTCEQDETCRASQRFHVLEDAFNQAYEQKQRVAKARAEALQRKVELEERYKALERQANAARCARTPDAQ